MIGRFVVLFLLLATAAHAQPAIPSTPAGRVLAAWLNAFNSGDAARVREFEATYRDTSEPVDRTLRFRELTGGFTLLRIEKAGPTEIVAFATEPYADVLTRIELTVTAGDSPKIVNLSVEKRSFAASASMRFDSASRAAASVMRGVARSGGRGVIPTAGDLLRFAQALEAGRLISDEALHEATTPQAEARNGLGYGFGFGIEGEGALRSYGHNGGAPGMNGDLRIYPELGYVLVGLGNVDPPAASRLIDFFENRMPAAKQPASPVR